MFPSFFARARGVALLAFCCAAVALPASAQTAASAPVPNPLDALNADAAVPAPPAVQPFAGYQSFRDEPVAPWRDSNAAVAPRQRGDAHGGHAGSGAAPAAGGPRSAPAAPQAPAKPGPAAAPPNHGHHQH